MQTFLPYEDFDQSAAILDNRRLNKQLLEGRQIANIIVSRKTTGGWVNHPAVNMWRKHHILFYKYLSAIVRECDKREISYMNNWQEINKIYRTIGGEWIIPKWLGNEKFHLSHRQNLYIKDPEHYAIFKQDSEKEKVRCCKKCNYWWPTHIGDKE